MKRVIGVFIIISILLGTGFFVNATVDKTKQWHSGDSVIVEIDGFNVTLQEVINNNYLGPASPSSSSAIPSYGHFANQIIITTQNGHVMTLQEAVDNEAFEASIENYTTSLLGKHSADEIEVLVSGNLITLQEFIDNENFGGSCVENFGVSCGATSCINAGTIDCGGICIGTTNKASGTSCDTGKTCNGEGICMSTECTPGDTRTAPCPRRLRQVVTGGSRGLTCQADGTWLQTSNTCTYRASSSGGSNNNQR